MKRKHDVSLDITADDDLLHLRTQKDISVINLTTFKSSTATVPQYNEQG